MDDALVVLTNSAPSVVANGRDGCRLDLPASLRWIVQ